MCVQFSYMVIILDKAVRLNYTVFVVSERLDRCMSRIVFFSICRVDLDSRQHWLVCNVLL